MKKRITLVFTIFALLASIIPCAYAAQGAVNAVLTFDNNANAVVMSGTANAVKKNTSFTLVVTAPDNTVAFTAQTVGTTDSEGVTSFEFDGFAFDRSSKSGKYTFKVSGYKLGYDEKTYTNTAGDVLLGLLSTVNAGSADADFTVTNADALSVNKAYAAGLGDTGKRIFKTLMSGLASAYTLPSKCETDDEYSQIIEAAKAFRNDYSEIVSIAAFNDITTPAMLASWINNYDSIYKLSEDDTATTAVKEDALYAYVKKEMSKTQMTERLVLTDLTTMAAVKSRIYEKALLTAIQTEGSSETGIILNNYQSLIGYNSTLFASLYDNEKLTLYSDFSKVSYDSYITAASKVNALAQGYIDARGGGGGGGGSSGGGGGVMPVVPQSVKNKSFEDLGSVEWAREAVEYLYNKDIVSGKGEDKFAPNDNITRAEFVKIIVLALDLPLSTGDFFTDVPGNSWYAPYVYAAYDAGLVSGDEENRFNPNDNITRQDMAVILYRAYKLAATYDVLDFADADSISDYARTAVAYFAQTGIVNGMDNNSFVPFGNATRAQASVMIFRSINHFGN